MGETTIIISSSSFNQLVYSQNSCSRIHNIPGKIYQKLLIILVVFEKKATSNMQKSTKECSFSLDDNMYM